MRIEDRGFGSVAALILLLLSSGAAAGAASPATVTTLANGLKVVVAEDHSTDLVAVDIWVRAGSVNETDETNGVSHFIEHVLFRATETRGPGQIDMEIESLGSSAEARTSRDWAHFYTVVATRYLDKALDILSDTVLHPKFRQEDIDHERTVILDEIARSASDPEKVLRSEVFRAAYTVHPYRLPSEGSKERISAMARDTIIGYYNKLYVPSNMTVVLAGDVTTDQATAAVKKVFGAQANKPLSLPPIPTEPARQERVRKVVRQDTNLTYLAVAFAAPSVKDKPDIYAMDVLVSYFGTGYQSWLATELRDTRKLVISEWSDFLTQRDPGLAILGVASESSKADKAEAAILARIAEVREKPISEAELMRAQRSLLGGYAFDVETFSGRATNLGFYASIDDVATSETYADNIRKVTAQDCLAVAKKYLDPEKAVVVVLGK